MERFRLFLTGLCRHQAFPEAQDAGGVLKISTAVKSIGVQNILRSRFLGQITFLDAIVIPAKPALNLIGGRESIII
jgi:hypothetical protein